jgi:hypothetical protein
MLDPCGLDSSHLLPPQRDPVDVLPGIDFQLPEDRIDLSCRFA